MKRMLLGSFLSMVQLLAGLGAGTGYAADRETALAQALAEQLPTLTGARTKDPDVPQGNLVINGDLQSTLVTGKGTSTLRGRISAHLYATRDDVQQGQVGVRAVNVVYFGVPQQDITGQRPRGKATGVLGFMITHDKEEQFLAYDPATRRLRGKLVGRLDLPQFADRVKTDTDERNDVFLTPTQPAVLHIDLVLVHPLGLEAGQDTVRQFGGRLTMNLAAEAAPDLQVGSYRIATRLTAVQLEISWIRLLEVAKRLCLQPVRIGSLTFSGFPPVLSVNLSGDGLAFGLPGAQTQWAKADVVFEVRDWITVWKSQYSVLTSTEADTLRPEVNVDDCVEVFFVDRFSPNAMWGGGATWSGGTASAKVISSDENADHGIDLTHLAHELGHAVDLGHPGANFPGLTEPSTGTLMCPSGFMNDNPQVNSQWNKDHVDNPLFTFAIKLVSVGPDCLDSPDCGACR